PLPKSCLPVPFAAGFLGRARRLASFAAPMPSTSRLTIARSVGANFPLLSLGCRAVLAFFAITLVRYHPPMSGTLFAPPRLTHRAMNGLDARGHDILHDLAGLTPASARSLLAAHSRTPWASEIAAGRAGTCELLGLFHAGDADGRPLPALAWFLTRPRISRERPERSAVALLTRVGGDWLVSISKAQAPVFTAYRGHAAGPPSLFNGENPARASTP